MRSGHLPSLILVLLAACGEVVDTRPLPDAPGYPVTDIPGAPLVFDDGECGAQPAPRSLAFANTGTAPLDWTATIEGAGFSLDIDAGSIAPGETATLSISANSVPASATVGSTFDATLVIQTTARAEPFAVPLSLEVHGGSLVIETPAVAFGQIQVTVPAPATPLVIRNAGDRAITLALGAPATAEFSATWAGAPAAITVEPGEVLPAAMTGFTPADAGARSDSVEVIATGPLCAGDAPAISLAGEGTFAEVSVTPGAFAIGTTACGSTAGARMITVENNYDVAINYTAMVMSGPYTISAAQSSGSVAANSAVTISVQPSAVPRAPASLVANALDGSVRVTTTAPGHAPATINLDQAASGAVLALVPASGSTLDFGDVVAGTPESQAFSVTNTGNIAASITVSATGSGFSASAPATVAASGQVAGSATQTVAARGTHEGELALATTTNRCQTSVPGGLRLTARALAPVAQVGTAPRMAVTCGAGAGATISISVRNTGDAPLVLSSPTITSGFTLLATLPLTIQPGATTQLQVSPGAASGELGGSRRTGTLGFRTNEIGMPERTVALAADVDGANIVFEQTMNNPITSLHFTAAAPSCPTPRTVLVRNTGTLPVTLLEHGLPTAHFRWMPPTLPQMLLPGAVVPTTVGVYVNDQDCAITLPERLRLRAQGNVCTLAPGLDLTYSITGQSTCFCQ